MENSIEEDMNYLDSMVKEYKQFGNLYNEDYEDEDRIYQALEHILSDYKRVLKENEELKESNRKLYEIGQEMCKQDKYTSENYIPVQKVKDKIEEYKNMLKTCNKVKDIDRIKAINERILELEELLEGRK